MNKTQKKEKCSEILNKYPINGVIEDIDEFRFLLSIFQMHPEWKAKEGLGIKYISIVKNQYNRCFQLNRIDNSSTDISFIHSISKPSKISEIKKACRDAIREYIVKFRDDNVIYGVSTCPIWGAFNKIKYGY